MSYEFDGHARSWYQCDDCGASVPCTTCGVHYCAEECGGCGGGCRCLCSCPAMREDDEYDWA